MSAPTITVYTKDDCQQCVAVKRALTARNLEFTEDDITTEGNTAAAKALGFLQAPVVIATFPRTLAQIERGVRPNEIAFAGYDPGAINRIQALAVAA